MHTLRSTIDLVFLVFSIYLIASTLQHISNQNRIRRKLLNLKLGWLDPDVNVNRYNSCSVHISQVTKKTEPSVVYTEEFHDLSSTSWRIRETGGIIQSKPKAQEPGLPMLSGEEKMDGLAQGGQHICPSSAFCSVQALNNWLTPTDTGEEITVKLGSNQDTLQWMSKANCGTSCAILFSTKNKRAMKRQRNKCILLSERS